MKSKTLFLLIICASFMVTTIETSMCSNNPIIYNNLKLSLTIDLVEVGFGKGFLPDKYIEIHGVAPAYPPYLEVYLMEDGEMFKTADIPFAFFSPDKNIHRSVSFNNWVKSSKWGNYSYYRSPFKAGQPFILEFFAAPKNNIIIYFNERGFFIPFSRGDLSKISQLYIAGRGAITVNSLILCTKFLPTTTPAKPPPLCFDQIEINNLTMPSIINLVTQGFGRGFALHKSITILGTPTAPTRFDISFAEDGVPGETADIPFHFSVDFAQNEVIHDTWIYGNGWTSKERLDGFPFKVGRSFKLEFRAVGTNEIKVYVYTKDFVIFNRYDMSEITQLEIKGAIDVSFVILCEWRGDSG